MGFCSNCGNKLKKEDKFCPECGNEVKNEVVETKKEVEVEPEVITEVPKNVVADAKVIDNDMDKPKTNGAAIAGFVCSLVGLVVFGLILGIVSICLGISAKNHMKIFENEKGDGFATTAIIIGIIDIVGAIVITLFKFALFKYF